MKKLTVNAKTKNYDITIKEGLIAEILDYLQQDKKKFLITNNTLEKLYSDLVSSFENKIVIKDGEEYKNFETFEFIINELLKRKIERKDLILALGGGVVGDLAGFAASSVLRGVNFVQIPTTLLSQVDSSVGGKTGFNTKYGKNLIGAFYQPESVLIDTNFLKTLPVREIKTGLGEVVKYSFIEKNCSDDEKIHLSKYLDEADPNNLDFKEIIYRSVALKASVVSKDEKEAGLRAVLNFGHTFAHSIETITNYKKFTHGEAVAMGMKLAFELSCNLNFINKEYLDYAFNLIDKFNLAPVYKIECDKDEYINIMKSDKKVSNSKIRLVLPTSKGEVKIFDNIKEDDIKKVL